MSALSTPPVEAGRIARFGAVGVVNTLIGYSAILVALAAGLTNLQANVLGFAVGLAVSFALNSRWTFQARSNGETLARYLLVFACAYAINIGVLMLGIELGAPRALAHLAGIAVYTLCFYVGAREFAFSPPGPRWQVWLDWPPLLVGLAWGGVATLIAHVAVSHDVIWQLWIARQLLGGAELYRDIIEINPPLWFWMAVPAQMLADALSLTAKSVIVHATLLWSGLSLIAIGFLLKTFGAKYRATVLLASLAAMTLIALPDLAQREHLALIGALPYALLLSRRYENARVSIPLATFIGLSAALGFALKHYFVLVPLLLEGWIILSLRRRWNPLRPETVALALCACLYGASIPIMTPDYLREIVPLVSLAYHGYETALWQQFASWHVLSWAVAAYTLVKLRPLPASSIALAIAAGGFAFSYFAQAKGWSYHALPATGCLVVAVAIASHARVGFGNLLRGAPYAACALAFPLVVTIVTGPYRNANAETLMPELESLRPGAPVMGLVVNPSRVWPMVEETGLLWPSRHFTYWMLPAIAMDRADPAPDDPKLVALAQTVKRDTLEDLRCRPPEVIVVSLAQTVPSLRQHGFDLLQFFREDAQINAWLDHYEGGRAGRDVVLHRNPDWVPPKSPASCKVIF